MYDAYPTERREGNKGKGRLWRGGNLHYHPIPKIPAAPPESVPLFLPGVVAAKAQNELLFCIQPLIGAFNPHPNTFSPITTQRQQSNHAPHPVNSPPSPHHTTPLATYTACPIPSPGLRSAQSIAQSAAPQYLESAAQSYLAQETPPA